MAKIDDIKKIIEQEQMLVFPSFDEEIAFALGSRLRERALQNKLAVTIEVSLWDRMLFFAALPGTNHANAGWMRRKINAVRHFHKPTYRLFLETGDEVPLPRQGLSATDFIFAGGAFPIRVNGLMIGAVAVSGLPQRDDHNFVVAVLCEHLGLEGARLALGPE